MPSIDAADNGADMPPTVGAINAITTSMMPRPTFMSEREPRPAAGAGFILGAHTATARNARPAPTALAAPTRNAFYSSAIRRARRACRVD